MSEDNLSLGEKALVLRKRAGLNLDVVARKLGVPKSALIALEKDRLSEEKIEAAIQQCRAEAVAA